MLPANRDDRNIYVHRHLGADEDEVVDAITVFADEHKLEIDRRHGGPGLLFVASAGGPLFARGDTLQVVITPDADGHEVEFVSELRTSLRRKAEQRRGHVVRSSLFAALFGYLGVRGLIIDVSFGDFMLLGVSGLFGRRAMRYARKASDDFDEVERKLVNELNRVCDETER